MQDDHQHSIQIYGNHSPVVLSTHNAHCNQQWCKILNSNYMTSKQFVTPCVGPASGAIFPESLGTLWHRLCNISSWCQTRWAIIFNCCPEYYNNVLVAAQGHTHNANLKQSAWCEDGGCCSQPRQCTNANWRNSSAPMAALICASMAMAPLISANGYQGSHLRQWLLNNLFEIQLRIGNANLLLGRLAFTIWCFAHSTSSWSTYIEAHGVVGSARMRSARYQSTSS